MKFHHKIMMVPLISAVAFALLFMIIWRATGESETSIDLIHNEIFHAQEVSHELETSALTIRHLLTELATTGNEDLVGESDRIAERFNATMDQCRLLPNAQPASLDTVQTAFNAYYDLARATSLDLVSGGQDLDLDFSDDLLRRVKLMNERYSRLGVMLAARVATTNRQLEQSLDDIAERISVTQHKMTLTSIVFLGVLFAMSVGAVGSILRPVDRMSKVAIAIAGGDMSQELSYQSKDALGKLADCFREMQQSLIEEFERRSAAESELLAAQGQIVQSEKMAVLGQLTAGLAHEMNTPLGALTSSVDVVDRSRNLLRDKLSQGGTLDSFETDPQAQRAITAMSSSIENLNVAAGRIEELVSGLKAFSQLDHAEYQQTDINDGLINTLTLARPNIPPGIDVQQTLGELPLVLAYPAQLNQLFLTLIRRAVRDMDGSGLLTITTSHVNQTVRIVVQDTGHGYDAQSLAQVFTPSFAAKADRVHMDWGMVTCSRIVDRHGGTISADSAVGNGSTFTVIIPVNPGQESRPSPTV